jgi:hypothetical protein
MLKEVTGNGAEIIEIEHRMRENFKLISIKGGYSCIYNLSTELLNCSIYLLYTGS